MITSPYLARLVLPDVLVAFLHFKPCVLCTCPWIEGQIHSRENVWYWNRERFGKGMKFNSRKFNQEDAE